MKRRPPNPRRQLLALAADYRAVARGCRAVVRKAVAGGAVVDDDAGLLTMLSVRRTAARNVAALTSALAAADAFLLDAQNDLAAFDSQAAAD